MNLPSTADIHRHLLALLSEGMEGPSDGPAYFSDHGPDSGLISLLAGLTPENASVTIGGNSIAGHVHHLAFAFRASTEWLRGNRVRPDWSESWVLSVVDEAQWDHLRSDLKAAFEAIQAAVAEHALEADLYVAISLGTTAHVAYHLGAIRQKVRFLQEQSSPAD